ncbi:hypothetical protein PILCRDRAFT_820532 [Piloderma croceum F 1598]|uniref:Uncharacterized protein n=1 Tax=Piloderma croceum (strain F 1598) TaxID=765440 RepID=A0A0C3BXU5_PILCF|nr:hypothetical protein PILCRDRAFT_820532 [Piloderma croceum F 1598]
MEHMDRNSVRFVFRPNYVRDYGSVDRVREPAIITCTKDRDPKRRCCERSIVVPHEHYLSALGRSGQQPEVSAVV